MSVFFKVGLPWAISLGVVFYIGLELGSKIQNEKHSPDSSVLNRKFSQAYSKKQILKLDSSIQINPEKSSHKDDFRELNPVYSPPLPPNLIKIMEEGDMVERMGAYMDALRRMDESSLLEVVEAFESLPKGYGRHLEMKLLMRSWANIDPFSALNYAENSLDEKSEQRFAMTEVLAGWAKRDPNSAIAWVKDRQVENPDSKKNDNLLVGVVKGLAENDLKTADDFFRTLPQGNAKWQASTFLAQEYAKKGTNEAIKWAEQFPKEDQRMRSMILGQMGSKLAQSDLKGTANWVESMPIDKASEQVMSNLLSRWASQAPQEAAIWSSQLPDSAKRIQAMKLLTTKWSLRDPVATAGWLNTFPPSAELDPVVGEFVNRISSRDPEGAVGWATSIIDQDQRNRAVDQALRAWNRRNPKEANAWKIENGYDSNKGVDR